MIRKSVSAIIRSNDQILIFKRHRSKWQGWGMVKGGIESGETPQQAIIREIDEEVGLQIDPKNVHEIPFITHYNDPHRNAQIKVQWFVVDVPRTAVPAKISAHNEWTDSLWVTPTDALSLLKWPQECEVLAKVLELSAQD